MPQTVKFFIIPTPKHLCALDPTVCVRVCINKGLDLISFAAQSSKIRGDRKCYFFVLICHAKKIYSISCHFDSFGNVFPESIIIKVGNSYKKSAPILAFFKYYRIANFHLNAPFVYYAVFKAHFP